MPIVPITDLADRRLDPYRALKRSNETRRGLFIAEGEKLVRRLIDSRLEIESLLVSNDHLAALQSELPSNVPTLVIPEAEVEGLVGFNFHRGILGCGRRPQPPPLANLCVANPSAGTTTTLVICPDVQDPENLGAIVRIAAAFGAAGLVLGPNSADPFSRRVQRVSMGNVYRLPIVPVDDVPAMLAQLRSTHGYESWATVLADDAETIGPRPRPDRLALVLGSEGHGLASEVVAACDRRVTIPMQAGVDSLNVAVAAGIFLFELTRSDSRCSISKGTDY
jgi:tRNA G18 (ribose-2'-O)-methylase SpoU